MTTVDGVQPGTPGAPPAQGLLLLSYFGVAGGAGRVAGIDARAADSPERLFARVLQRYGLEALQFSAVTRSERHGLGGNRDLSTLGDRLTAALQWLASPLNARDARFGVLGWNSGCAVAARIAEHLTDRVGSMVLCGDPLQPSDHDFARILAPTLLIVGGNDAALLLRCRQAMRELVCAKRIEVVPGAGQLFGERAMLETAADMAGAWLSKHR